MRFRRLQGIPQLITCSGCLKERTGGGLEHRSASGRVLDVVYQDVSSTGLVFYCQDCAARHAEGIDQTRSRTQFFQDTRGQQINNQP